MIIVDIDQNSEEWDKERLGAITSSCFGQIIDSTGNRSKTRQKYMDKLAAELITGERVESYKNSHMEQGHARESENRDLYAFRNNVTVETIGFCWKDEKKLFGSSPDGLVDSDGLVECKNHNGTGQISRIRDGWTASEHHRQAHGQMLVTGRKWCDVVSYCRGMKTVTVRFLRDEVFLRKLEVELIMFHNDLHKLVKEIQA